MNRTLQARPNWIETDAFPVNSLASSAAPPTLGTIMTKVNARAVEIIARPERVDELREYICEELVKRLRPRAGFEGAFVMASHKEPRRLLILTLWETRKEAAENCWESEPGLRAVMASMVDVCARVDTYETLLAGAPKPSEPADLQLC